MDIRATLKPSRAHRHIYVLRVNGARIAFIGRRTLGEALTAARAYLSGIDPWQLP